jgi:hypothetical protein
VQHQPSDFISDAPAIDEMLAYIGKKTCFNPVTMFSQVTEDEGDRTAADYADAEPGSSRSRPRESKPASPVFLVNDSLLMTPVSPVPRCHRSY